MTPNTTENLMRITPTMLWYVQSVFVQVHESLPPAATMVLDYNKVLGGGSRSTRRNVLSDSNNNETVYI